MNMKSLLAIAGITATSVACATVTSQNTLCRIAVNSTAKSIILALPLQTVGGTEMSIKVTDLVMTTNLDEGDSLLAWNATESTWDAWVINSSGNWASATSVSGFDVNTSPAAEETALACGKAVWLNRPDPAEGSRTNARTLPVYLYGQYFTSGASTTVAASGSTFVGPCATTALPINGNDGLTSKKTVGEFADGDQIVVVNTGNTNTGRKTYTYKTGVGFATQSYDTEAHTVSWTATTDTIPVGLGFMYVRKANTGLTFTW